MADALLNIFNLAIFLKFQTHNVYTVYSLKGKLKTIFFLNIENPTKCRQYLDMTN